MDWYRTKTALIGLKRLATLSEEDKQGCVDAYRFFQRMQAGEETTTEDETTDPLQEAADYCQRKPRPRNRNLTPNPLLRWSVRRPTTHWNGRRP